MYEANFLGGIIHGGNHEDPRALPPDRFALQETAKDSVKGAEAVLAEVVRQFLEVSYGIRTSPGAPGDHMVYQAAVVAVFIRLWAAWLEKVTLGSRWASLNFFSTCTDLALAFSKHFTIANMEEVDVVTLLSKRAKPQYHDGLTNLQ